MSKRQRKNCAFARHIYRWAEEKWHRSSIRNNNNALLTYPIGLITFSEASILGNNTVRSSAYSYWLENPNYFSDTLFFTYSTNNGAITGSSEYTVPASIRPAIVLNSNAEFSSGTGSTSDPWIVKGSEMTP